MKSSATPAAREPDCLISKPFVKPIKVGIEQLVIIVKLSLYETYTNRVLNTNIHIESEGNQDTSKNNINSIIYMTQYYALVIDLIGQL